ncbi:MAG TPA: hypothetical protein VLJ86_07405, partial [Ramlibacter sp.]|nr:hypothetical protein [Ramlibacter sp.]
MTAATSGADPTIAPPPLPPSAGPQADSAPAAVLAAGGSARWLLWIFAGVAGLSLAATVLLWQKLSGIQEQLARQSADAGATAVEARTLAREAQETARETASRQAVTDNRLSEVTLQRTQLEELMQS